MLRSIHVALVFFVLAFEDLYCIILLYLLRGATSWAWYRLCMALHGIAYLVAILALLGIEARGPSRRTHTQARARRPSHSPYHNIPPQPSHPARNQG